jgi:hypothetical protein
MFILNGLSIIGYSRQKIKGLEPYILVNIHIWLVSGMQGEKRTPAPCGTGAGSLN